MSGGERKKMTCSEFQEVLPYIFESGGDASEMEHLKTCPVCSDLVHDLRYIADQELHHTVHLHLNHGESRHQLAKKFRQFVTSSIL